MLHIDLETKSEVNLLTDGAYNYAMDPSTDILCMCYAFDDDYIQEWDPARDPFPEEVNDAIKRGDTLCAHNAQFERLMFEYVICNDYLDELGEAVATPDQNQWLCTATLARAHALPGKLDDCARALGLTHQKDKRGAELIKLMSIPPFQHSEELMREMIIYCKQDVAVEREIHSSLGELPPFVWDGYDVSERINDRGILVDVEVAEAAIPYASGEQDGIIEELTALTNGEVLKPRSPKLATYVHDALPEDMKFHVEDKSKKSGLSLDGSRVTALLEADIQDVDLRRIIELKALASKSSVSKFQAMLDLADPDDHRVRGAFLYMGAGQTGRFSSRGLQLHNMPRDCAKDPEAVKQQMLSGRLHTDIMRTLSSMIRPSIRAADGKSFVVSDWAGIEARGLPWVTGEAERVLDIFREGRDVYVEAAQGIFLKKDINKDERMIGKVAVLSLGYGGAVGAFQSMARAYGVHLEDTAVRGIVDNWRADNPWATRFWGDIEMAITDAYNNPGEMCKVGKVAYYREGEHLYCVLPSGRELMYPFIRREIVETRWGPKAELTCIKASLVPAQGKPWPRMKLWGGLLAENITQALCADLLREALVRLDKLCDDVVMHVHDEIVMEVYDRDIDESVDMLTSAMLMLPDWAKGLPLDQEHWVGKRYRK